MKEGQIFVFGSNEAGRHGGGAARTAFNEYGAKWGRGFGLEGYSFAIPTKDWDIETLDIQWIIPYIERFKIFARKNPDLTFYVTKIGCGLAGYTDADIAPLFANSPSNCMFDSTWKPFLTASQWFD